MGILVGRDAEVARGRAVFDSAAHGRQVRALRIVGPSGVGKTALAGALLEAARESGWLVVEAPGFRIHATLPLFAARRVVQSLLETLGEKAARYQSGLQVNRDHPEEFEEAFIRVFEGVTLDYRLVLGVDDAQWVDVPSRTLIARTLTALAERSIVLLSTERSDELTGPAFSLNDDAIPLGELSPQASIAVVRAIYPGVTRDVASAIAATTRGHAMDVVAVATAARESGATTTREVSESTRRVVARDLALLEASVRTFLQLCSLIEEPIDLELLRRLYPQEQLVRMILPLAGRYLVTHPDGLRFVHATIMESVVETIPIELPLRYRIIEAIQKLPAPRLEDYERLAKQSAAVGDRELQHETLLKLADIAASRGMSALSIDATERALAIRQPEPQDIVPMYARLTQLYNTSGREIESIRACQSALAQAKSAGVTEGLGAIIASMALGMWHAGRTQEALAELRNYEALFTAPADRAHLLSVGAYIAMQRADESEFERFTTAFRAVSSASSAMVVARYHTVRAYFEMRRGNEALALEALRSLEQACESVPFAAAMLRVARTVHAFYYNGVTATEQEFSRLNVSEHEWGFQRLVPHLLIARGALEDAREFVVERLSSARDPQLRHLIVGAFATATALQDTQPSNSALSTIESEALAYERGSRASTLWPIAAAWTVLLSRRSPKRAKAVLDQLLLDQRNPLDYTTPLYPLMLVLAARHLDDRPVLERIAQGRDMWVDRQPWQQAQFTLARGMAAVTLGKPESSRLLEDAAERFEALGAPCFSAIARNARSKGTDVMAAPKRLSTTRREREIAALVAEGLTNRQIAEKLVLSERTVEGHIANLFGKVNVNSRTQLAAWYLRSA